MKTPISDIMLNDRGFAFDPASGETFQLNTTGLRIVRLLQQGDAENNLLGRVLEEFEVDENTARRDLETFLQAIGTMGWQA